MPESEDADTCGRGRAPRYLRSSWILSTRSDPRPDATQPARGAGQVNPTRSMLRVRLQGVRDDRLALRVGDGPEQGHRGGQRATEPRDIQRAASRYHAEGRDGCAERPAECVGEMLAEYAIAGISCAPARGGTAVRFGTPAGAFYSSMDVSVPLARWHPTVSGARHVTPGRRWSSGHAR